MCSLLGGTVAGLMDRGKSVGFERFQVQFLTGTLHWSKVVDGLHVSGFWRRTHGLCLDTSICGFSCEIHSSGPSAPALGFPKLSAQVLYCEEMGPLSSPAHRCQRFER